MFDIKEFQKEKDNLEAGGRVPDYSEAYTCVPDPMTVHVVELNNTHIDKVSQRSEESYAVPEEEGNSAADQKPDSVPDEISSNQEDINKDQDNTLNDFDKDSNFKYSVVGSTEEKDSEKKESIIDECGYMVPNVQDADDKMHGAVLNQTTKVDNEATQEDRHQQTVDEDEYLIPSSDTIATMQNFPPSFIPKGIH